MEKHKTFFEVAEQFEIPIETAFTIRQCYEDEYGDCTIEQLKEVAFRAAFEGMRMLKKENEDETDEEFIDRMTTIMDDGLLLGWCNEQIDILEEMEEE